MNLNIVSPPYLFFLKIKNLTCWILFIKGEPCTSHVRESVKILVNLLPLPCCKGLYMLCVLNFPHFFCHLSLTHFLWSLDINVCKTWPSFFGRILKRRLKNEERRWPGNKQSEENQYKDKILIYPISTWQIWVILEIATNFYFYFLVWKSGLFLVKDDIT